MNRYQLVVSVVSACDAALLINSASANWFYDDDDNGNLDPKIVLTRPVNGRLDVWIGTYDVEYCDAQLQLETFDRQGTKLRALRSLTEAERVVQCPSRTISETGCFRRLLLICFGSRRSDYGLLLITSGHGSGLWRSNAFF